jgi:two-component system response regulator HydG
MKKFKILVVDDDPAFCLMLATFLGKKGFDSHQVNSGKACISALEKEKYHLIITDLRLPDLSGIEILKSVKNQYPEIPVILMTGYGEIRTAVQAIKMGAFEYVSKPVNPDEILMMVNSALDHEASDGTANKPLGDSEYLAGYSDLSLRLEEHIELVAPTTMTVLIKGESGTGKEFVARKIHRLSERSNGPFVALDCGALSNELAASELFGHVKGSFTGAIGDKTGQFELADGGTLFLDEIGNLSYEVQVKLLRALQEKQIKRVGGKKDIPVDVRIIAASNDDLREAARQKGFREDLYHRLNEFSLEVPSLRDRGKDIELFAQFLLDKANRELKKSVVGLSPSALDIFHQYSWPGNIREMKNIIKRGVLLCQGDSITPDHLPTEIVNPVASTSQISSLDLRSQTENQEREIILSALEKTRYNKSKAAELLRIDRKTLYNKMKQYEIKG